MTQPFTASEVRELVSKYEGQWIPVELTGPAPSEAKRLMNMLNAYADRLEAQERAVPVAWRQKHLAPDESQIGWILTETRPAHFYCEPLYTHPSPSDAERLAEALRNLVEASHYADAPDEHEAAEAALAAHSAQAQPPVQSEYAPTYPDQAQDPFWKVPGMVDTRPKAQPPADQFDPERNARHGDLDELRIERGGAGRHVAIKKPLFDSQAHPPVASVTDAMVERALSAYYVRDIDSAGFAWEDAVGDPRIAESDMRAALEAALAAQENSNG